MGNSITLKIAKIKFMVEADGQELATVERIFRQALEILAQRLAMSPPGLSRSLKPLVREYLEVGPFTVEELLSVRGAERIAEDLYQKLLGG